VIWDIYFSPCTSIEVQRGAVVIHFLAAAAAIIVWIIHVYAAIWVKGSLRAMSGPAQAQHIVATTLEPFAAICRVGGNDIHILCARPLFCLSA
jgi:cytochrome b subunit of formate dehydrogenase